MNNKYKLVFLLLLVPVIIISNKPYHLIDWIEVEYYNEYPKGTVNKYNLENIPDDYLLAMVAIHECINICPQDAPYIIEATWNRVFYNWGNYGGLKSQLKSSEFKGLLDENFYFNPFNIRHCLALKEARQVIKGKRRTDKIIVGWLTHYDNDSKHVNRAMKRVVSTPTWHKFWTK